MLELERIFKENGGYFGKRRIWDLFNIFSWKQPDIHNRFYKKEIWMVNTITWATTRNWINFYSYSEKFFNNELTIAKDWEYAGTVFLQTEPFIVWGHCMWIFSKMKMSNEAKVYISGLINKVRLMWRWYDRPTVQKSRLEELKIILPFTKNWEIAFDYMEYYIRFLEAERIEELEAERIEELEAYLLATWLKEYNLTEKEQKALDRFEEMLTLDLIWSDLIW